KAAAALGPVTLHPLVAVRSADLEPATELRPVGSRLRRQTHKLFSTIQGRPPRHPGSPPPTSDRRKCPRCLRTAVPDVSGLNSSGGGGSARSAETEGAFGASFAICVSRIEGTNWPSASGRTCPCLRFCSGAS